MKLTSFVQTREDIQRCARATLCDEVLIEPACSARLGRLSLEEAEALRAEARAMGLRPVLVWDTLVNQASFQEVADLLMPQLARDWAAVRVRDVGAAYWLRRHASELPLQLLCEEGNHNLEGLQAWCSYFGSQLERLVLSIELTEERLQHYAEQLPVGVEVLGAGRIQMFYSPRKLLRKNFLPEEQQEHFIEVTSASPDSHMREFPTVETVHGTMMFLDKDQYILDKLKGLTAAGFDYVRIDARHFGEQTGQRDAALPLEEISEVLASGAIPPRKSWPHRTLAPFFRNNNTTRQFSRLRSPLHARRDHTCLAQVVAGQKNSFLVLQTLRSFSPDDAQAFVLPVGEEIAVTSLRFRDVSGMELTHCEEGKLVTIPWLKKVGNGSLLIEVSP